MNLRFENDVKMYGIQTFTRYSIAVELFENDVKMYGIQTPHFQIRFAMSLRMM